MAMEGIFAISEFGLQYQKARVDAATLNIANANVVQPANGGGFKPLTVNVSNGGSFIEQLHSAPVVQTVQKSTPDKLLFKPEHPAADNRGYVHYANINMAEQMVVLTEATRAYEANVKAFNTQMSMSMKALELGK